MVRSIEPFGGDRSVVAGQPELNGRFGMIMLTDLLQLLATVGATGTLTLQQGWNGRTIVFQYGRITAIASVTSLPDTVSLLLASGRIDASMAEQARRVHAEQRERTLERVLRDLGMATDAQLRRCYVQRLEELLYTFFLWRECTFRFVAGEIDCENGVTVDLSMELLILDGIRQVDEWIAISPIVPSVRMAFRRTGAVPGLLPDVQAQVYAQVNGQADVATLAHLCGLTQFACARALHALGTAGLVRAVPPDKPRAIELFTHFVEGIYMKLELFGYASAAREFSEQLNQFARQYGLKVRMQLGKVVMTDTDLPVDTTLLIDRYRTFLAVQLNKFERTYELDVARGLFTGLYRHLPEHLQPLMAVYDFVKIEGIFETLRKGGADEAAGETPDGMVASSGDPSGEESVGSASEAPLEVHDPTLVG